MKKIIIPIVLLLSLVALGSCKKCKKDNGKTYTSETYSWETKETDKLKLTQDYKGKDFIKDGIGEVTPVRYVDGDTTVFKTASGEQFTTRYNGINTPESTYRIEPWGYAASKYNKTRYAEELQKGTKIVLQTEDMATRLDSTGQRYLAWIWFISPDGNTRLFNLEMAELGYAHVKSASGTQYEKAFTNAIFDISIYKLRIYGETDPEYDYSNAAKEMSIKQIREQYGTEEAVNTNSVDGFTSPLIKITGVVVRKQGQTNAYIQQYDEETNQYYGIYVYGGYNSISKLIIGAKVEVTGKIGYYNGSLQLTDITSDSNIKVFSFSHKDEITVVKEKIEELDNIYAYAKIGTLVQIENLKVLYVDPSDKNASANIVCQYTTSTGEKKQFNIRIDSSVTLINPETGKQLSSKNYKEYFEGKTFKSITGVVNYFKYDGEPNYSDGNLQLALTDMTDVVFA